MMTAEHLGSKHTLSVTWYNTCKPTWRVSKWLGWGRGWVKRAGVDCGTLKFDPTEDLSWVNGQRLQLANQNCKKRDQYGMYSSWLSSNLKIVNSIFYKKKMKTSKAKNGPCKYWQYIERDRFTLPAAGRVILHFSTLPYVHCVKMTTCRLENETLMWSRIAQSFQFTNEKWSANYWRIAQINTLRQTLEVFCDVVTYWKILYFVRGIMICWMWIWGHVEQTLTFLHTVLWTWIKGSDKTELNSKVGMLNEDKKPRSRVEETYAGRRLF